MPVTFVQKQTSGKKASALALLAVLLCLFLPMPVSSAENSAVRSGSHVTIALFDFEDYTLDGKAAPLVMPLIRDWLVSRGYAVLDEKSLDRFLVKERVRSTAYVSSALAAKMKNELGVDAVLLGGIYVYGEEGMPKFGLSARLLDTGRGTLTWANFASASGDDFTGLLGLGTVTDIETLSHRIIGTLFASFSTVPAPKDYESTYKVAVMPFQNKTGKRDVGMIATSLFLVTLTNSHAFVPVEYGDVWDAIVKSRIRRKGQLNYQEISDVASSLKVDAILVGTVDTYSDGSSTNAVPIAVVTGRLLDARTKRIHWYESMNLGGDDLIKFLDRGKIRTVDKTAFTVIKKLTMDMEKRQWQ